MDDQRDYAEEAYNRAEYQKEQEEEYLAELREKQLIRQASANFWNVASSDNPEISYYLSPEYQNARTLLLVLIADYYPQLCASDVFEIFTDSGESVEYAADYLKSYGLDVSSGRCEQNIGCRICTVMA